MKLALHIGTEKTGTTLLQEWLYHNRDQLSRQGYFLSQKIGFPNNRNIVSYFRQAPDDFWNRYNIRSEAGKKQFFATFLADFEAELKEASKTHHTLILSSEHLHSRLHEPEELDNFAEYCKRTFDETKVICYLRPQWAVHKSLFSTAVKTNTSVDFANFNDNISAESHYYNYYDLYRRWGERFGFEAMDFRIYDRNSFASGDLRRDFIDSVGGKPNVKALDFSIESANESVKLLCAHGLIGINKAVPLFSGGGVDKRNYYYKSIISNLDVLNAGEIVDEKAGKLADIFRESNTKLAKEAFGRDTLFAEPETPDKAGETFTASEVAAIVEKLVYTLTKRTSERILVDDDAETLRDVAIKTKAGEPITNEQSLALMKLAARARPAGGLIQQRIADWSKKG